MSCLLYTSNSEDKGYDCLSRIFVKLPFLNLTDLRTTDKTILDYIKKELNDICLLYTSQEKLISMDDIKPGLFVPGTRIPGCFDMFEMSVRAVLGQQITVKAVSYTHLTWFICGVSCRR